MPPLDLFWGGADIPQASGRDQAIAAGAELEELGYGDQPEEEIDENDDEAEPDYYNPQTGERSRKRRGGGGSTQAAKRRIPGGIAPIHKPITTDYDSDDARIIDLKQQLYSDDYVANKLAEEGRMRYSAKTISSRWMRLRKLLVAEQEQMLDDELTDWHVGEDDSLKTIFDDIEKKYEQKRATLENAKWKEVSLHLAEKLGKKKYTGKACRERHEAVLNGTALLPIELDQDQAGRRKMREERIAATRKARDDAENAKRQVEKEKRERMEAKKLEQAEANMKRVAYQLKRKTEKEEQQRIKHERQVNKEKARRQKVRILTQMRLQRDWEQAKYRAEKSLYRQLTGGAEMDGKPARSRAKKGGYDSDEADDFIDDFESDDEEMRAAQAQAEAEDDADVDEESMSDEDDDGGVYIDGKSDDTAELRRSTRGQKPAALSVRPAKKTLVRAPVTEETLLNPRSVLSNDELDCLLHFRELPRRQDETHAEVVARLVAADQELKSDDLDQLLAHASEKMKGKKVDKIRRLQEADAKKSRMGEMGLTSTDVDFMETYDPFKQDEYRPILEQARRVRKDSVMS